MAIVVLEFIAVVFLHIEVLLFNLPARSPNPDDYGHIGGLHLKVREPAMMVQERARAVAFPDLHERAPHPPCCGQRDCTGDTVLEKPASTGWPLVPLARLTGSQVGQSGHLVIELAMRARLTRQHVM